MTYEHKIYIQNSELGMLTYTYYTDYNPDDVHIDGTEIVGIGRFLYNESKLEDSSGNVLDLDTYLPAHTSMAVNELYNRISGLYDTLMMLLMQ